MKLITTAQLRKSKEKTKLDDETLIVCAMDTNVTMGEDEESRSLDFTISSEAEDSYRDIVKADGWDLERYLKNPVVLWAHIRSMIPIGKATNVRTDGNALKATATFAERETNEFADDVFRNLKAGFLNATSVGFIPQEWSWDEKRGGYNFIQSELYEFSVVPVPANPDALMNAIAEGENVDFLREWCEKTLDAWRPDGHMAIWVPRDHIEDIHKLASGESAMVSMSSGEDGNEAVTVTNWHQATDTTTSDLTIDQAYHEFWSPCDYPVLEDPADSFKLQEIWTSGYSQPVAPDLTETNAALDELRKLVEELVKKVDGLTEKATAPKPPPDALGIDLAIALDEDDHDDIAAQLDKELGALFAENADLEDEADIDPEVLRAVAETAAANAILKRTGKLPKEV